MPTARDTAFTSGKDELAYIINRAGALGVDARAALAVAAHEGITLPAQVGDSGSSFGPWQLHAGGALPADIWARGASYSQQWANSPAGIDYALSGIASVSRGETGETAISHIVTQFERPLDPGTEVSGSISTYHAGGRPGIAGGDGGGGGIWGTAKRVLGYSAGDAAHDIAGIPGDIAGLPGKAAGAVEHAAGDAASAAFGWVEPTLIRMGKIMLGSGLVLLGLYLIARSFNAAPSVTQVASLAATRGASSGGGGRGGSRSAAPRRRGDAAAARGEPVTQGGQPQPLGRSDRAAARREQRQAARADAAFGEVPF